MCLTIYYCFFFFFVELGQLTNLQTLAVEDMSATLRGATIPSQLASLTKLLSLSLVIAFNKTTIYQLFNFLLNLGIEFVERYCCAEIIENRFFHYIDGYDTMICNVYTCTYFTLTFKR
jgi:hypothetical protein